MILHPTLILNEKIAKNNIKAMVEKCRKQGISFRPHFKTHQSRLIGSWFREQGVHSITVSSIKMGDYFADNGWNDITIAIPVNTRAADPLNSLAEKARLKLLIVDVESLQKLDEIMDSEVSLYIELDPGYGRSGLPMPNSYEIHHLITQIEKSRNCSLSGFYVHAGHTYKCRSAKEVSRVSGKVLLQLEHLKKEFGFPICFGDTPSCSVLSDFGPVDELSPGNFVFYDWMQTRIGSCNPEQIAIALYCPVLAKYEVRSEILIHGGAVHLSKDFILNESGSPVYGVAAQTTASGWSNPLPEVYLKSVSQEHGILSCPKEYFETVKPGDLIPILPIHSCLTADLMGGYLTLSGKSIDHLSASPK